MSKRNTILCALLFAATLFALSPATALAAEEASTVDEDALYEAQVVTVADDSSVQDAKEYVTYEKTSGNLKVLLCGVNDANKDALADAVLSNFDQGVPVKFVNDSFIDAEKYSVACETFDKYHCWLASTSNTLTLTGWASSYVNPLTGKKFTDEDDTLSFISSSFINEPSAANLAYAYFFDGMFGGTFHTSIRTTEATAIKPFAGTSHTGFDPTLCYAGIAEPYLCDSTLSALEVLESLNDHALEMSISGDTSHSVTVMGAVIDESKTGAQRYVGVLIADSDNDASELTDPPETFAEANELKASKTNSYTLYHLSVTSKGDTTGVLVENYLKYKPNTYVGGFTKIAYNTESARKAATETAANATKDAKTTGDVALTSLTLFDENVETLEAYEPTAKLTLQARIIGMNTDVAFDAKTTDHAYLENKIECYRDGELVGTIDKPAWFDLANGVNSMMNDFVVVDLSSYDFLKVPGNYKLSFYLNSGNIKEAYVMNNDSPQSVTFTIKSDEGDDSGNTNTNTNANTNSNSNTNTNANASSNSTNSNTTSTSNATNSANASSTSSKTGDFGGVALVIAALVAALAVVLLATSTKPRNTKKD